MDDKSAPRTTDIPPPPDFHRLAHELRNHLFTLSLGMKSLEVTRSDPERFAVVLNRIRGSAFEGLEDLAVALDKLAESSP